MQYHEITDQMRQAEAAYKQAIRNKDRADNACHAAYATDDAERKQAATRDCILCRRDIRNAAYECRLAGWGWARNAQPCTVTYEWEQ